MANNFFGAIALIGGAAGALDAIDGAGLADLDAAFVQVGGQVYLYTLDASSGVAESSPETISPDTNAGTKRWILQSVNVGKGDVTNPAIAFGAGLSGFYEVAANRISLSINGARTTNFEAGFIESATGTCWRLEHEASTYTNPVFVNASDDSTGMGFGAATKTLSLIANSIEGLRVIEDGAGVIQCIVPQINNASKPTIGFGDGDTGFYESADGVISIAVIGGARFIINSTGGGQIRGSGSTAAILNETPSATNPSLVPKIDDIDTGVGTAADDAISLVAGGVEGFRSTEAAGVIANRASDVLGLSNTAEGNVGNIAERTTREVHTLTLGASSVTTTITIPTGAMLLGVSFNVNTAVTDTAGDDTWSAAFSGGSTATLATAAAAAVDTKVNTLIVPEIASGATEVTFTPNGGNFGAGVIEVVAYYKSLTSLGDV